MNIYVMFVWVWFIIALYFSNKQIRVGLVGSYTVSTKEIITLSFVILFGALISFRGIDVGTDTAFYSYMFTAIGEFDDFSEYFLFYKAPVYVTLCKTVFLFCQERNAMVVITGMLTILVYAYFVYKKSEDIVFSLFLFLVLDFYLFAFNASRQMLALSFLPIVYMLWESGKFKKGFGIFLLAGGIHSTALLFILVLPLFFMNIDFKKFLLINFVITIASLFGLKIVEYFQMVFSQYSNLMAMGYDLGAGDSSGGRVVYALIFIAMELIVFYYNRNNSSWCYKDSFLKLVLIVNISLLSMIVFKDYYIFARVEKVFFQFSIILLPIVYNHLFVHKDRLVIKLITCIIFSIPFVAKTSDYLPYSLW